MFFSYFILSSEIRSSANNKRNLQQGDGTFLQTRKTNSRYHHVRNNHKPFLVTQNQTLRLYRKENISRETPPVVFFFFFSKARLKVFSYINFKIIVMIIFTR